MAIANPQEQILLDKIRLELHSVGIVQFPEQQLAAAIKQGETDISFMGNRQTHEYGKPQQMNYTVFLKKYEEPNLFHTHAIEASIENQANKTRKFDMNKVPLTVEQIQNLLNGRSLRKTEFNRLGNRVDNRWYRLDFSSKDEQGQHSLNWKEAKAPVKKSDFEGATVHEPPLHYHQIGKYPIKEKLVPEQRLKVVLSMLRGDAVQVSVMKNNGTAPGYMQLGARPDSVELLMHKDGKLVRVGTDLKEVNAREIKEVKEIKENLPVEAIKKRKGKSI